ncbi:MAG: cyclase family protein [Bacteroidales bacterium]
MIIYDISRDLISSPLYPGTLPPRLRTLSVIDEVSDYRLSEITVDLHTGTHVDAPSHCLPQGMAVDVLPLGNFIGEALVFDISCHCISDLSVASSAKILLLKGSDCNPLSVRDCAVIKQLGYITVGVDALTVGGAMEELAVHRALLSSGMGIIENLCLDVVDEGVYFLSALPVKIVGAEASFCRAVLIG